MENLVEELEELKKSEIREKVRGRINQFKAVGEQGDRKWFSELSFCILTANFSAQGGIDIQNELGAEGFIELSPDELEKRLKELGHRFYRTRAGYIVEAREYSDCLKTVITRFTNPREAREWLVENVKGIGYKEGSHFLRNVGYENLMILDRHILRIIDDEGVIEKIPKTLTRKRYLKIEGEVEELASRVNMNLGVLDLYLWYMCAGEILK